MFGCLSPCLPLYDLYRNKVTEYTETILQTVKVPKHADELLQTSNGFRNFTNKECAQAYKVSIQLVDQSHFNFYTIEQWHQRGVFSFGHGASQERTFYELHLRGTIQVFPETGAIWVRWRQSLRDARCDLRFFTIEEFTIFVDMLNNANAPIRDDILNCFQEKASRKAFYKT